MGQGSGAGLSKIWQCKHSDTPAALTSQMRSAWVRLLPIANKLDLGRWGGFAKAMAQEEEILGSGASGDQKFSDTKSWGLGTACGTLFSQSSQEPGVC